MMRPAASRRVSWWMTWPSRCSIEYRSPWASNRGRPMLSSASGAPSRSGRASGPSGAGGRSRRSPHGSGCRTNRPGTSPPDAYSGRQRASPAGGRSPLRPAPQRLPENCRSYCRDRNEGHEHPAPYRGRRGLRGRPGLRSTFMLHANTPMPDRGRSDLPGEASSAAVSQRVRVF